MQQPNPNPNPNPNPSQIEEYPNHIYNYAVYYSQLHSQNPNPNYYNSDPHKPHETLNSGISAHQPGLACAHYQTADAAVPVPSGYYTDPNTVAVVQNLTPNEAVWQYGANPYLSGVTVPPNGTGQLVPANPNPVHWTQPTVQPRVNGTWKRGPKKTKVVQSVWCEVCRVDCNTKDVLDQHKWGKKHKKNLEKLQAATAPSVQPPWAPTASAESSNPVLIGPQENPEKGKSVGGKKAKKKAGEPVEDLETKKRKILKGGATVDAVRTCAICNVVCNSELVFRYHLVGRKHASMVEKHACRSGVSLAT